MSLVKPHTIYKIYLSSIIFKSTATTELKSVALEIATEGLDLDLAFFLHTLQFSTTLFINFLTFVDNFQAFL